MGSLGEAFSSFEYSLEPSKRFILSLSFNQKFRFVQGGEISSDGGDHRRQQQDFERISIGVGAVGGSGGVSGHGEEYGGSIVRDVQLQEELDGKNVKGRW